MGAVLPPGSLFALDSDGSHDVLRVPPPRKGVTSYFTAAFMIFWLGGWVMGWKSAATSLLKQGVNAFLAVWLAAWTIGGVFAMVFLYRLLRPAVPESFTLLSDSVLYDPGMLPFQAFSLRSEQDVWRSVFNRRLVQELTTADLISLKLRETENGNRLTVDKNGTRLELAVAASEIDREWLYAFLSKRYCGSYPRASEAERPR